MKTILCIEDNTTLLENTFELLEMNGYRVLGAENGAIGVRLAHEQRPDLII
jgi:DNA-binding response OmpR family regulator